MRDDPPAGTPFQSEDDLLAWLRELDPELEHWIGDDTCLLPEAVPWVVSVDTQIEGTHYLPGLDSGTVARRLLAVNLSDLAAAGAEPAYCFLSLSTPPGFDHRTFFRAFLESCHGHRLQLAGGDLSRSDRAVASLTVLGRIPDGGRWLERKTGNAGDTLWLGGQIGASALGRFLLAEGLVEWKDADVKLQPPLTENPSLGEAASRAVRAHLRPTPQLALGEWLGKQDRAAAIDVSDGLGKDLSRLCQASGVGATINVPRLPLPRELDVLSRIVKRSRREIVLAGGEDYVLLFALPPAAEPPSTLHCKPIGTLTEGHTITWSGIEELSSEEGSSEDLGRAQTLGWDHLSDS